MKRHSIKSPDWHGNRTIRGMCAWIAAGLLALPVAGVAAYLPMIGPAPLRFQAPPHPPMAAPVPLVQDPIPEPEPDSTAAASPAATNPPPAQLEAVVIVAKSPDPADATNAPPAVLGPTDASLITPQMMMHFFQRKFGDTNGPNTDVVLPFVFTPPVPLSRPASKATFSTP